MKCDRCDYYHPENNTCASKKAATGLEGYLTLFDKIFCSPYNRKERDESFEFGFRCGIEQMQDAVINRCKELGIDYNSIITSEGE